MKIVTKARVRLVVELNLDTPFGGDIAIAEVNKTARREAHDIIERMRTHGLHVLSKHGSTHDVRVIGEPVVTAILTEETF